MDIKKIEWWKQGNQVLTPVEYGTLYNQSSWPNYNNWTANGFTPTVSNNELTVVGASSFNRYLVEESYGLTNLSNYSREVIFRPQTKSSAGDVFSIGIRGTGTYSPVSFMFYMVCDSDTAAVDGQLSSLYTTNGSTWGNLPTITNSGASRVTYSLNDRLKYTLTRSGYVFTFKCENLNPARLNSVTVTYTINPLTAAAAGGINWIGKFCSWAYSGTAIIESDTASTTDYKNCKTVFLGDSKTEGFSPSTYSNLYCNQFYSGSSTKYVILAKGNNCTQDILNSIDEVIAFNPQYVVLNIGSNDIRSGVSSATWQSNYSSIVSQLKAQGISIVHIRPPKEGASGINVTALDTYIQTFTSDTLVDCFTNWNTGTMLNADTVHINNTGNTYIKDQLLSAASFLL